MIVQCGDCHRDVDKAETFIVSWDDGEPNYMCNQCRDAAQIDNHYSELAMEAEETP